MRFQFQPLSHGIAIRGADCEEKAVPLTWWGQRDIVGFRGAPVARVHDYRRRAWRQHVPRPAVPVLRPQETDGVAGIDPVSPDSRTRCARRPPCVQAARGLRDLHVVSRAVRIW